MNLLAIDTVSQTVSVTADGPRGRCTVSFASKIQHAETLLSLWIPRSNRRGLLPGNRTCPVRRRSRILYRITYRVCRGKVFSSRRIARLFPCPPHLLCRTVPRLEGSLLSVLDAKKKRFYVQLFSNGAPAGEVRDCSAEEAVESLDPSLPLLITGPDAGLFAASLGTVPNTGQFTVIPCGTDGISRTMVEIALRERTDHTGNRDDYSAPIYVRKSDAETAR